VRASSRPKVMILGSGPNRIGQGIEFDYCCVHASFALRAAGYETIMVNCNPETVSTDYDTSDRLYFEPLTREDVLNVIEAERPEWVIVALGGQTPLKLAGVLPPELIAQHPAARRDDLGAVRDQIGDLLARRDVADDRSGGHPHDDIPPGLAALVLSLAGRAVGRGEILLEREVSE